MASNYRGLHQSEEGAHELPHLSSSADPYASVPNSPGLQSPDLAREGATNSTLNLNGGSATPLSGSSMEKGGGRGFNPAQSPGAWSKRKKWIVGGTAALIASQYLAFLHAKPCFLFILRAVIIAAVVGGVVGSKNSDNKDSDSGNRDGHQNAVDPGDDDTDSDGVGRDGAKVTME